MIASSRNTARQLDRHERRPQAEEPDVTIWQKRTDHKAFGTFEPSTTRLWAGKRLLVLLASYALVLLTVAGFYKAAYQSLLEEVAAKVRDVAVLIAINIDPIDVEQISGPADIDGIPFKRLHQYLKKVKATQPDLKYIDIFRPPGMSANPAHWTFVVDLYPFDTDLNGNGVIEKDEEGVQPGRIYEPKDAKEIKIWQAALQQASSATDHFWSDEWGTYISGFASIRDPLTQKPIALVEVDTTAEQFAHKRESVLIVSLIAAVILLAMVTLTLEKLFSRTQSLEYIRTLSHNLYLKATEDDLTGVANRRHFYDQGEHAVAIAHRYRRPISLVMLDADHFKRINDTYGHKAGDDVLINIARLCRESVRSADQIGRFGGEEFLILMPEMDRDGAVQLAQRLRTLIEDSAVYTDEGERVSVTVSIGVAQLDRDTKNFDTLVARADQAMYKAKIHGRNCVVSA